jgi:sugar phosphate isomerase/epimerase
VTLRPHPRLTVSALSSWDWTLDEDLAFWASVGIGRVGIWADKLDAAGWAAGLHRVGAAGLDVGNVIAAGPFALDDRGQWEAGRQRLDDLFTAADLLGAPVVAITPGAARSLSWDEAAGALAEAVRPVLDAHPGTALAVEHANPLRVDLGFLHTLRDAVDLAERADVTVLMEVSSCWAERDLLGTVARHVDRIGLVQVSDFVVGTRQTPDRVVPGDGDLPLRALIGGLLDAGYVGDLDLEVVGPRIEEEGYASAISRSVEVLSELLDDLGA